MLAKSLVLYVLTIGLALSPIKSLPEQILCLRPPFTSLVEYLDSYFMVSSSGQFWRNKWHDNQVYKDLEAMNGDNSGVVGSIKQNPVNGEVMYASTDIHEMTTFDTSFRINFDDKCAIYPEILIGLRLLRNGSTAHMKYDNKWSQIQMLNDTDNYHNLLDAAVKHLNTSKLIKAVLVFKPVGYLFIQDYNMVYITCKTGGTLNGHNWEVHSNTDVETKKLIVFETNGSPILGEIFGGYVEQNGKYLYLFAAQISSTTAYIRRHYYRCKYNADDKTKVISMSCEKVYYNKMCELLAPIPLYFRILIIVGIVVVIVAGIGAVLMIIRCCQRCGQKRPKTIKSVPKTTPVQRVGIARKRVLPSDPSNPSDPKPKPGLARVRTQDFPAKK